MLCEVKLFAFIGFSRQSRIIFQIVDFLLSVLCYVLSKQRVRCLSALLNRVGRPTRAIHGCGRA